MPNEKRFWLALHKMPGLGSIRIRRAVDYFGSAKGAWTAPAAQWLNIPGISSGIAKVLKHRHRIDPYQLEGELKRLAIDYLTLQDELYPPLLKTIYDPPVCLFAKGKLESLHRPCVGIVGTRRASPTGLALAHSMAKELAQAGVTVVSGLARGIDSSAHRGALESVSDCATAAVLGSGLDTIYPPEHRLLAKEIISRGVIITEYWPGASLLPGNFPARNRILSGLCRAVVVIEAGDKSGALITADFALEQGREVFAIPRDPLSRGSSGVNTLLKEGATIATSAGDILAYLGLKAASVSANLSESEKKIIRILKAGASDLDAISKELGVPVSSASVQLLRLELKGAVLRLAGERFVAAV